MMDPGSHCTLKMSDDNQLDILQEQTNAGENKHLCGPCAFENKSYPASTYCFDCEESLCEKCTRQHKSLKLTREHVLKEFVQETIQEELARSIQQANLSTDQRKPGRPTETFVTAESITLVWTKPEQLFEDYFFQIGYKDIKSDNKWKLHKGQFIEASQNLTMKADGEFVFRVRMASENELGPYSEESEIVRTPRSTASTCVESSRLVNHETIPMVYALPMEETENARNNEAKTRKLEITGLKSNPSTTEKTFLMIGATGTGKTTLVNGMANYILGVKWDDPFRFSMVDLEKEELENTKRSEAVSQTEWITCYKINAQHGSRVPYNVTIIDTPGFGDTRGLKRDQQLVEQIRQLFKEKPPRGVVYIDAICFLIKAPDARLTPTQSYIFQSIMALFGKDVAPNICALITFADGEKPPVLSALQESELPFNKHFVFNNSGLFANNENTESGFGYKFWEMGTESFIDFFDHVKKLNTKSLQQTNDVLEERKRLEITLKNLQSKLDIGLELIKTLETQIQIFQDNKSEIAANANFKYKLKVLKHDNIPLPEGHHTTNCTHCHMTCHDDCVFADNKEKARCAVMKNGNCTVCKEQCSWTIHANTPYIIRIYFVEEERTYEETKQKYELAQKKKLSQEQVLENMNKDVKETITIIDGMLKEIKQCNDRLTDIALRPNPLSVIDHIDLMIENERMLREKGWKDRTDVLIECRNRATLPLQAEQFQKTAYNVEIAYNAVKLNESEPPGEPKEKKNALQKFCSLIGWK